MQIEFYRDPTPHAVIPELLLHETYNELQFPDLVPSAGGRIGRDLYFGEPGWDDVMTLPGWHELSSTFMSETFVRRVIAMFADDIRRLGCGIDPGEVYVTPRAESRSETEQSVLSESDDPNNLFVRFDLQAGDDRYAKGVHCDHLRRVIGGVLFLCSSEDEGLDGGEFALYSDLAFNNDRQCHQPQVAKVFPVRHNEGILFLNSNEGFHGPLPIRQMSGMRRWVYYSISSRRNVWTVNPLRS